MSRMRLKRPVPYHKMAMKRRRSAQHRQIARHADRLVESSECALEVVLLFEVIVGKDGVLERALTVEDRAADLRRYL